MNTNVCDYRADLRGLKTDTKNSESSPTTTMHDLQNATKKITDLFDEYTCPSGNKMVALTTQIKPVIEQMENIGISLCHRFSVLFSLFNGPTRMSCTFSSLSTLSWMSG